MNLTIDIGGTHIRVAAYEPDSTKPIAHTPGVFDHLMSAIECTGSYKACPDWQSRIEGMKSK